MAEEKKFIYEQLTEQFTDVINTVGTNEKKLQEDLYQAKEKVKKLKKEIKQIEELKKEIEIKSYYYMAQQDKIDELNSDTTLLKLLNTNK